MGLFGCRDGRLFGYILAMLGFVSTFLAFVTPYWLKSDFRAYSAEFLRTGLWETCFRSHTNPDDLDKRKFYVGCRWILTYEYNTLRDTLELPFFVSTQVFYTFAFTAHLLASILLVAVYVCLDSKYELRFMRLSCGLLGFAALCSTIAVTVFGSLANQDGWMPDPMHNYLSWSFACAVIGAFCELVSAMILHIDSRHVDPYGKDGDSDSDSSSVQQHHGGKGGRTQHLHTFG